MGGRIKNLQGEDTKMGNERVKTSYPGVVYRIRKRQGGQGMERVYYAIFKRGGKGIEAIVGRQYKDNMTPAKANIIRGEMIEGRTATRAEERAEANVKVWTFAAIWQEYKNLRTESRSLKVDDGRFEKHIAPTLGNREPSSLKPLDVDRLRINLMKKRAPQTVKHVIGLIKRIAAFGLNKGLCQGLSFRPQMPAVDNKVTEDLSPEQLDRLLEAIDVDENKLIGSMMKMALSTGMRRGELFRLKWDDVDFRRGFICITESKGGKATDIPLNDATRQLLDGVPRTSVYVFPGDNGGQRVTATKACNRIRERAGLPKTFRAMHGLRHVFASHLASSGQVDLYVLQRLLTHKSPVMTQRYAHLRDATLQAASAIGGDILTRVIEAEKKIIKMR